MKSKFIILLLFIVSLLPLLDLFHIGLPITHDGQDHVARIANFYQSLSEGNIIPRWAGKLNWGYGHPILMFLYPLSSYATSLIHFIGFNLVDSTKLVFGLSFIASIFSMYLWSNCIFGKRVGILSAVLYGFAPYRFVDLYVRGAIGEHLAFIFPPLIMYFICQLSNKLVNKKNKNTVLWSSVVGISISLGGLILSHNAISIMFLPLIILYAVYLAFFHLTFNRKKFLYYFLIGLVGGFGLSAFFWIPAFFEGKYTLRDIVTRGYFGNRFVPWGWFIYSPWNYGQGNEFTKSVGLVQVFGLFTSLYLVIKTKIKPEKYFISGLLIVFLLSIILMTEISSIIWNKITLLQKFQFPWRLLSICVFISAIISGWSINKLIYNFRINNLDIKRYIVIFIIVFSILNTYPMWKANSYSDKPESFYSDIYSGTTDTGESSPIWSIRFMEKTPTSHLEAINGKVTVQEKIHSSTIHTYKIISTSKVRIVENTLYFPGWEVYINGRKANIEFQDPEYRGLITFWIEKGENQIKIIFRDTKLRSLANIISLITICLITGITLFSYINKTRFLQAKHP
jgi:hypothetical protein